MSLILNIEIIEKQVNGLVELIEKNVFSGSKIAFFH